VNGHGKATNDEVLDPVLVEQPKEVSQTCSERRDTGL
jgi:hypothetical protein